MDHSQNISQFKRLLFLKGNSYYFCLNHHVYKSRFLKYDEEALSAKKDIFSREKITFPINNHVLSYNDDRCVTKTAVILVKLSNLYFIFVAVLLLQKK